MKKLTLFVFLSILYSCNYNETKNMDVLLSLEKSSNSNILEVKIINNTKDYLYINKIGGIYLYENLTIVNEKYFINDRSFIYDEKSYNKDKSRTIFNVSDSINNSMDFYTELEDLEKAPFTNSKNLIKNAIESEYKKLVVKYNPKLLTENDISLIKSLILYKYQGTIFLKPKEIYRQFISINSLYSDANSSKVVFEYSYNNKVEELNVSLEYPGDPVIINTIPLEKIGEFKLFTGSFKSDTLYIN